MLENTPVAKETGIKNNTYSFQEVLSEIKRIIKDVVGESDVALTPTARLIYDLSVDSINISDILCATENKFHITLPFPEDIDKNITIQELSTIVQELVSL